MTTIQPPVRIRLDARAEVSFGVYFRAREDDPPSEMALRETALSWVQAHVGPPLKAPLAEFAGGDGLAIRIVRKEEFPPFALLLMREVGGGELEEHRYTRATHVALFFACDDFTPPRLGLWAPLAAACAAAASLKGVAFDLMSPRIIPCDPSETTVPADGAVRALDVVSIHFDREDDGLMVMLTTGLNKFGLYEIELPRVPPHMVNSLTPVIRGLAQVLLDRAADAARSTGEETATLELASPIEVASEHIREAHEGSDRVIPGRSISFGLVVQEEEGLSPHLVIGPPPGATRDQGTWLHEAFVHLRGPMSRGERLPTDYDGLRGCRKYAALTLPTLRRRFQEMTRPGWSLFVRARFPVDNERSDYLWLSVNTWSDGRLRGQLMEEPEGRDDLRGGQTVEAREEDIFAWTIAHPDGHLERFDS